MLKLQKKLMVIKILKYSDPLKKYVESMSCKSTFTYKWKYAHLHAYTHRIVINYPKFILHQIEP